MKNNLLAYLKNKLFFLFFLSQTIFSQTGSPFTPKINNIPSSPEAALLGRFGDIPVSNYTGVANISIPIYTIKESGIEIPIELKYHSSGIKVADEATWVGLGWDLSPGGSIIHEIRGKRDDQETTGDNTLYSQPGYTDFKNYFYTLSTGTYNGRSQRGFGLNNTCHGSDNNTSNGNGFDSTEILYKLLEGSGQPDIYHYDFAGHSGKFYIHPESQQIILIDKKENITFERLSDLTWIAKTQDGNVFKFGIIESSGGGIEYEYTGRTYKLSNITFSNSKTITFSYIDEKYLQYKALEYKCLWCIDDDGFLNDRTVLFTYQNKKTLSKIITTDAIIDFNLEDREDIKSDLINNPVKRLKSINITSAITNKKIKSYEFGYSYFPFITRGVAYYEANSDSYTNRNQLFLGKRLKLDFVKEVGYDAGNVSVTTQPAYKFEYDLSNTMPLKNSCAIDFWGYYNGEYNDKLLPNLDYFDYPNDIRYQNLNNLLTYNYTGANRYTNNVFAGANMLKKITYPTGGYSEFEYEPNSFTNQFIPDNSKNIYKNYYTSNTSVNVDPDIYFKLSKSTTIHFENRINNGVANQAGLPALTPSQMSGCSIKLSKFKFSGGVVQIIPIKQWDLSTVSNADFIKNGGVVLNIDFRINFDPDPDPTFKYQVSVTFPDNLKNPGYNSMAGVSSHITFYDDTGVDTTISNQCGMRIKSIKNYAQTGILTSNKFFKYFEGKLLNKFEPLKVSQAQHTNCKVANVAGAAFFDASVFYYNRISISSDDFGVDGGNIIGYGKVEEIDLDKDNLNKGKILHSYINEINETKKGLPNIPYQKNGLIFSETIFDKTDTIAKTNYTYKSIAPVNISFGVKIYNQSFGNTEIGRTVPKFRFSYIPYPVPTITDPYYPEGLLYKYNLETYPLNSEWWMLDSKISKQFVNNSPIITKENYTYTVDGKKRTSELINSNNESLITTYYYANDSPVQTGMITNNMTGIPLVTENRKNAELLSRQETKYTADATTNNLILPKYLFAGKGTLAAISPEKKVTYDKYDAIGNLQQYTLENGTSVTILWGYGKTLPIAKIENATFDQVAAALGITTTSLDGYTETFLTSINNLRSNASFVNSIITTYTHIPLVGVSTITDPRGLITHYEYDSFNRLLYVKDQNLNVLQRYCYNYLGQQTDCSVGAGTVTTYKNVSKSAPFTKQACAAGSVGSAYVYSVPAGVYSSTISQADADGQANAEITANGQNFANANGSCLAVPTAPTGLAFTSATATSVSFSWSAVAGATGYKIYKNGVYVSTVTALATSGSLTGLTASTAYNVQVLATNTSVDGALCASVSMSTAPSAPTGLAFTSATAVSVNFSWSAVAGATAYKIYKNGAYVSTVAAPTTSGSLSGLVALTAYGVQVLASNGSGDGALCASVSMSTLPATPTGLAFTSATATSVSFSWSAVTGATGYKIYKNGAYVSTISAPATAGSLSGLTASTVYNVQILATNTSIDGALCAPVSMSTAPSVPTGLAFTSATAASVSFSWGAVTGATGYKIYKNGVYVSTVTAPTTSGSISGLAAGANYSVQVLAYNGSGDGDLCTSVAISTLPSIPTGLVFSSATASSLNFSWAAVTGATGYKIYINGVYNKTQPVTLCTLSGLPVATSYNVQVLAYNSSGEGALCASVAMSTVLSAPTGLTFTVASSSSINLSWTAVSGATGYKIYKNGTYVSTQVTTTGSLSGLAVGTTYNIQVLAYNGWGDGVLSSSVPMSTGLAAPTGLTFTSATASVLNFSWTAVAGATGYKIYKNGVYISTVASTTGSLSGLTASTSYSVQVQAYDARGDGAVSSSVAMITTAPSMGFYNTSGTYPTTSSKGLNGTIVNTLGSSIYIYVVVQSAGASSGSGSGSVTINGTNISASGTFTNYGQGFVSTNYVLMSSSSVDASGYYYGTPGSQMYLAYSLYPGGSLTYWSNSN